jgi:hypothetical protein
MLSKLFSRTGEVEFNVVLEESPDYQNQVTSNAVENGSDVADHVKNTPETLAIRGVITGDQAAERLKKLREFLKAGELLTYIGRNVFTNVVIESLTTRHTAQVRDGYECNLTLKHVRVARSREVYIPVSVQAGTQTKSVQHKGRQQPAHSGHANTAIDGTRRGYQ